MSVSNINSVNYSGIDESLIVKSSGDTEPEDLDEKLKKMQEMMSNMEEMNKSMLKTLYMQIFMAPEEKIMEW